MDYQIQGAPNNTCQLVANKGRGGAALEDSQEDPPKLEGLHHVTSELVNHVSKHETPCAFSFPRKRQHLRGLF